MSHHVVVRADHAKAPRLVEVAALLAALDGCLLVFNAVGQVFLAALAGHGGYAAPLPSSGRAQVWVSATVSLIAFGLTVAGALWLAAKPARGRSLLTGGLAVAVCTLLYEASIGSEHVSGLWAAFVLGVGAVSVVLAWAAGASPLPRGRRTG